MKPSNDGGIELPLFKEVDGGLQRVGSMEIVELEDYGNGILVDITIDGKSEQIITLKNSFIFTGWVLEAYL